MRSKSFFRRFAEILLDCAESISCDLCKKLTQDVVFQPCRQNNCSKYPPSGRYPAQDPGSFYEAAQSRQANGCISAGFPLPADAFLSHWAVMGSDFTYPV